MKHDFSNAKILVVGDVMLDQYWIGRAGRISPEAPVPVVNINSEDGRAGGAANVALNISALGASAHLMGVVGEDEYANQLQALLEKANVTYDWIKSPSGTICKLRVLSHHQQLIRMDFEKPVPNIIAQTLAEQVTKTVANYDVLVISDYAKGALQFVEIMIKAALSANVPVLVDPKGVDFERYLGATLIKPNQSEFEAVVGECNNTDELIEKAGELIQSLNLQSILVTRSEHGMALISKQEKPYLLKSQAQEVFDVTGAGDTVIASLATGYASGMTLQNAVNLANQAASIVVRKVGTSTVTKAELDDEIKASLRHQGHVALNEEELLELVQTAQNGGERVVITNGCFDLLHSGHIRYLNEAAKLGERLVVAVNSDESVQALKGPTRPVVPLSGRMELLSALSCVDWVIPFNEETPERLICKLKPDVLVKGGDYKPDQIAGARCVQEGGGQVEILSFWDGFSTSNIVERIRNSEY